MSVYTEADLARIIAQPGYRVVGEPPQAMAAVVPAGVNTAPRYRSKTEARFADYLFVQQLSEQCEAWWYEPLRLWLAPGLTYTPDFLVQTDALGILALSHDLCLTLTPVFAAEVCHFTPHTLCFYEAKASQGHVYEPRRALDRLKMAAHLYPMFHFRLAQWDRKRHDWTITEITP